MTPTAKLRWMGVNFMLLDPHPSAIYDPIARRFRVLQQWWESGYEGESGEWRDIPVEQA